MSPLRREALGSDHVFSHFHCDTCSESEVGGFLWVFWFPFPYSPYSAKSPRGGSTCPPKKPFCLQCFINIFYYLLLSMIFFMPYYHDTCWFCTNPSIYDIHFVIVNIRHVSKESLLLNIPDNFMNKQCSIEDHIYFSSFILVFSWFARC